jgi:cytoskeletal protein RodZ
MEKKSGVLTHFGGIIRVIILIVSVAIITFFVVRFIRNRETIKNAERSSQVSRSDAQSESDKSKDTEGSSETEGSSSDGDESQSATIPGGVAEGTDDNETRSVPAAGMGTDILAVTVLLGGATYFVVRVNQKNQTI